MIYAKDKSAPVGIRTRVIGCFQPKLRKSDVLTAKNPSRLHDRTRRQELSNQSVKHYF